MAMDEKETVTVQEMARLLGVSAQNVRQYCDQGHIVRSQERGRLLLAESIRGYCEQLRKLTMQRGGSAAQSLAQERAALARKQAELADLKAQTIRGELVPAREVEGRWRGITTALRSRLLAAPSRVHARLPHLKRAEVDLIDEEIRQALEELANDSA
jgi:terminase small subunit / prophage DNA-packing protein